jgi:hypothetical protein
MIETVQFKPSQQVENIVDQLLIYQAEDLMLRAEISARNQQAFKNRYLIGQLLYDNEDTILEDFKTWKAFSEHYGLSPSVVSNNLRAYRFLFNEGLLSWDSVEKELRRRKIDLKVNNFEKLETLFLGHGTPERPKDEKRLENLYAEVQDIISRNESATHNEVKELAIDLGEQIVQAKDHIVKLEAHRRHWHNDKYLEWVRSLGYDAITGRSSDKCEPHHTYIHGEQGGIQDKLPDCLTIPLSPDMHRQIESGVYKPTESQISKALINTMSLFIITHLK